MLLIILGQFCFWLPLLANSLSVLTGPSPPNRRGLGISQIYLLRPKPRAVPLCQSDGAPPIPQRVFHHWRIGCTQEILLSRCYSEPCSDSQCLPAQTYRRRCRTRCLLRRLHLRSPRNHLVP